MDENDVTKRGRRRKYRSNAERQLAYRKRRAKAKAEQTRQSRRQFHARRVFIDPNKVMDEFRLKAMSEFKDWNSWINEQINWKHGFDHARLPEWIASLRETRQNLNRFIRTLKENNARKDTA